MSWFKSIKIKDQEMMIAAAFLAVLAIGLLTRYNSCFLNSIGDNFSDYPTSYEEKVVNTNVEGDKASLVNSGSNSLLPNGGKNLMEMGQSALSKKSWNIIGESSKKNSRNLNLQLRADPPIGKMDTGPFNQSTITQDEQGNGLPLCK